MLQIGKSLQFLPRYSFIHNIIHLPTSHHWKTANMFLKLLMLSKLVINVTAELKAHKNNHASDHTCDYQLMMTQLKLCKNDQL